MKGNPQVIEKLQVILNNELAASDQYFVHSRMLDDWGLDAIAERMEHESLEERQHADVIIKRMLFLEAAPDLTKRAGINIGQTVPEMIDNDLEVEYSVRKLLLAAIATCEQVQDYQTRESLLPLLHDTEEDHIHFLEQQQFQIKAFGLQNYLQTVQQTA